MGRTKEGTGDRRLNTFIRKSPNQSTLIITRISGKETRRKNIWTFGFEPLAVLVSERDGVIVFENFDYNKYGIFSIIHTMEVGSSPFGFKSMAKFLVGDSYENRRS